VVQRNPPPTGPGSSPILGGIFRPFGAIIRSYLAIRMGVLGDHDRTALEIAEQPRTVRPEPTLATGPQDGDTPRGSYVAADKH
jgi:hypothetical protein